MKYYQQFAKMGIFSLQDAIRTIGNEENAKKDLASMIKRGLLYRIRKNLYSTQSLTSNEDLASNFSIACNVSDSCFLAYHSAFEFYGCYNQVYNEIQACSLNRVLDFEYKGTRYHFFKSAYQKQIEEVENIKITSIERTIVDSINMVGKVIDLEELVKCIELVSHVDENKLKEMLLEYNKDILYRKTGYVLSFFKDELGIHDDFFEFCKNNSNNDNVGYISHNEYRELDYINEWGIYAYKNLRTLSDKGESYNV